MLKIKMVRLGKNHFPFYRIVVAEEHSKLTGRPAQSLGFHNPKTNETEIDIQGIKSWIKKGAQMTASVAKLCKI